MKLTERDILIIFNYPTSVKKLTIKREFIDFNTFQLYFKGPYWNWPVDTSLIWRSISRIQQGGLVSLKFTRKLIIYE